MECIGFCDIPLSSVITSNHHLIDRWYPFTSDVKGYKEGEIRISLQYLESDTPTNANDVSASHYLNVFVDNAENIIDRTFNGSLHPMYYYFIYQIRNVFRRQ